MIFDAAWLERGAVIAIHIPAFAFILPEFSRIIAEIYGLRRGY